MAAAMIRGEKGPAERLFVLPTPGELSRAAAGRLWGIVRDRVAALARPGKIPPRVHVALSGGNTPRGIFEVLSAEPYRSRFPWECVHFYQVDERWVPPDDPESNARMIREALLFRAPVPPGHFHFVDTGLSGPEEAARRYEEKLREAFPEPPGRYPRFDAILLGMGEDGHVASLFPGEPVSDGSAWVFTTVAAGNPPVRRVTLTLPVINAAAQAIFIVSGKGKARALSGALAGNPSIPASRVALPKGKVTFLADSDAASLALHKGEGR